MKFKDFQKLSIDDKFKAIMDLKETKWQFSLDVYYCKERKEFVAIYNRFETFTSLNGDVPEDKHHFYDLFLSVLLDKVYFAIAGFYTIAWDKDGEDFNKEYADALEDGAANIDYTLTKRQ